MRAIALYACSGSDESELSFKEGNIIYKGGTSNSVLPADEDGWYIGEFQGTKGLFPGNYVRFEEEYPAEFGAGILKTAKAEEAVATYTRISNIPIQVPDRPYKPYSIAPSSRISALETRRTLSNKSIDLIQAKGVPTKSYIPPAPTNYTVETEHKLPPAVAPLLPKRPPPPPVKSAKVLELAKANLNSTKFQNSQSSIESQDSGRGSESSLSKVSQLKGMFESAGQKLQTRCLKAEPNSSRSSIAIVSTSNNEIYSSNSGPNLSSPIPADSLPRYRVLFAQIDIFKRSILSGKQVLQVWLKSGMDTYFLGSIW